MCNILSDNFDQLDARMDNAFLRGKDTDAAREAIRACPSRATETLLPYENGFSCSASAGYIAFQNGLFTGLMKDTPDNRTLVRMWYAAAKNAYIDN